ncbi:hypothetical protein Hanom_Chr14g01305231 [Helianthus anomalus]
MHAYPRAAYIQFSGRKFFQLGDNVTSRKIRCLSGSVPVTAILNLGGYCKNTCVADNFVA